MILLLLVIVELLSAAPAAWYLFAYSVPVTLAHTVEEILGRGGPFWWYAHQNLGVRLVGYLTGLVLFAGLATILIGLAVWGYLFGSDFARGVLIGARWGDALLSHVGLRLRFSGSNPGLRTSPLYVAEGIVAPMVLPVSALGFLIGFGGFALFWTVVFTFRHFRPLPSGV